MVSVLSFVLFSGLASAHVTVWPTETKQGAYEKFTVRVPSEEENTPTMKVELAIPDEVDVSRVEPKPGWRYEFLKDDTGKVTRIAWTSEGAGLLATEFTEFNISGKVGDNAESIAWKAYQTYGDGSVVEWVGAADSEKPASVTTVLPSTGGENGHGAPAAVESDNDAEDNLPLYLSIAALVLGLISLILSLRQSFRSFFNHVKYR